MARSERMIWRPVGGEDSVECFSTTRRYPFFGLVYAGTRVRGYRFALYIGEPSHDLRTTDPDTALERATKILNLLG